MQQTYTLPSNIILFISYTFLKLRILELGIILYTTKLMQDSYLGLLDMLTLNSTFTK